MKNKVISLSLFLVLSLLFGLSCEKEINRVTPIDPIEFRQLHQLPPNVVIENLTYAQQDLPVDGCLHESCASSIQEALDYMLIVANDLCEEIWAEVICCHDGLETYVHLVVRPTDPACNPGEKKAPRLIH